MLYRPAFPRAGRPDDGQRGFTLIEALVTLALVGILASIAYPSYTKYVERSVLSDGKAGLFEAASMMESCYTKSYSGCLSEEKSQAKHYIITQGKKSEDGGYTLTAKLQGSSNSDGCDKDLTLNAKGEKIPKECW